MSLLFKLGYHDKIYDSYKHDDIYAALYAISLGLSDREETQAKLKRLEEKLLILTSQFEHVRIYEDYEDGLKMITVRQSNKVVASEYFLLKLYSKSDA